MKIGENDDEIALYCTSGIVQYASSAEDLLAQYNEHARLYELRVNQNGETELWHKGHRRCVGVIRPSKRG